MSETYTPWNKYFWGAVLGIVMLFGINTCVPPPAFALPIEELTDNFYNQAVDPSVQIRGKDGKCSGTIISKKKITANAYAYQVLTARHCINPSQSEYEIQINDWDGILLSSPETVYGHVTRVHKTVDLAIFEFSSFMNYEVANIMSTDDFKKLKLGQDAVLVSYPNGLQQVVSEGVISRLEWAFFPNNMNIYLRCSAEGTTGSSGSSLFIKNPEDNYEIVGVLSWGFSQDESGAYYVPAPIINEFLKGI